MNFTSLFPVYFIIPLMIVLLILMRKKYVSETTRLFRTARKRFITFSRVLIFLCLLMALTYPYIEYKDTQGELTKIKVLVDNSNSMNLFDTEEILKDLQGMDIPIEVHNLDMGDYTSLGSAVLSNIAPDENVLLITDGQNNFGPQLDEVALFASSINSRLYAVNIKNEKKDAGIVIEGPSKVVSDVENTFNVLVKTVGSLSTDVQVYLDDKLLLEQAYSSPIIIKKTFNEGTHVLKAVIKNDDHFKENNEFYKTITVHPKSKILMVSNEDSPLYKLYKDFYDVDLKDKFSDPKGYLAVVLDDVNSDALSNADIETLDDYLGDENGLFVVGGKNSYDYGGYNKSLISGMLPVLVGKAKKNQDMTNLVILIDTGFSGTEILKSGISRFDVQKAVTADILSGISGKNKVAIMEANFYMNTITGLSELEPKREKVIYDLGVMLPHASSQLRYAYQKAYDTLKLNTGSKSILIITDGNALIPQDQAWTLDIVKKARGDGIKTFIVSVGDEADEIFLKLVKEYGNGEYFKVDETSKLKLYFGDADEAKDDKELSIFVYDSNHFITRDIEDIGDIYGFNTVYPKPNSRMLLTTSKGDPVLTIWNYGLGRVASLSTDDGNTWNPNMMKNSESLLKTMNWLIENPERNNPLQVDIPDLRIGENSVILVKSDKMPQGLKFYESDKGIYKTNIYPNETGYIKILDNYAAVNYKKEYLNLGMDPGLEQALAITGGKLLDEPTTEIKTLSHIETTRSKDMSWLFLGLAMIIYLIELLLRRIQEIKISRM